MVSPTMLRLRPRFPLRLWTALGLRSLSCPRLLHGSQSQTPEPPASSDLSAYLTNSCGLSPVAALSVAKKLRLRTTGNADSILNHLRAYGFTDNQIAEIVTKFPMILGLNSDKIIKPKLDFFFTAGFSSARIAKVITKNPTLLRSSLARKLEPNLDLLKTILGGFDEAAKAILAESRILQARLTGNMLPNIKTLEELGVPQERIVRVATAYTRAILQRPAQFSEAASFLKKTGFDPLRETFARAIVAICGLSHSTRERKLQLYRSLGWSKEDIDLLFKNYPFCLLLSEEKIRQAMGFYVEKLQWKHSFLAARSKFLSLSLHKTIIPRYNVFNILESKGLVKRIHLSTHLQLSEKRFQGRFVIKYGQQFPELLEAYKIKLDEIKLDDARLNESN